MDEALSRIGKKSRVVGPAGISGLNGWKKTLTDGQVSRVLSTVNAFGLSFYSTSEEADYAALCSPDLPGQVRTAGTG